MAISVKVPKEITEYEEKIILGLSIRKMIALAIACVLGVGTYFFCWHFFNMTIYVSSDLIFAEAIPIVAIGFIPKKNGIGFERQLYFMFRQRMGKNKLPYEAKPDLEIEKNEVEGKSKYAWIFEKGNERDGAGKQECGRFGNLYSHKTFGEKAEGTDEEASTEGEGRKRGNRLNFFLGKGKSREKAACEYEYFTVTKKGRKRKSKAALREIKAARQENKAAKYCSKETV